MADQARAPRSWLLWATAVAGIAMLTGTLILSLASARLEQSTLRVFLIGWIVIPYVVSGLVAWWRRPANRLGLLMLLTGFVMALTPLQWSSQPLLHSIGNLFDMVPAAMFLHVFLAFPSGRLVSRGERWLVGSAYAITLGLHLIKIFVGANPNSLFSVLDNPVAGTMVENVQLSLVVIFLLLGAALLVQRGLGVGHHHRRPATLVVDVFSVALVLLALLYLAGMLGWPLTEVIRSVTFAALGLAPVAFLFALLDLRLARGDIAGLLVELRSDPTSDLRAPLARALRDPSLRLAYWLPEFVGWADQTGAPVPAPEPSDRQVVRYLERDGEPVVALTVDRSLEEEYELLDTVLATASIALENGRLRADLGARLAELRGSRIRVLEAGRRERQRLERDLHDGAQVRLVALSLELGMLGNDPAADPELQTRLRHAQHEVSASLEELRDVARGIYPAVLSGHGLAVALESLAARAAVPVSLSVALEERPSEAAEVAAYYIVSEALANIGKHSTATSAEVRVGWRGPRLVVTAVDNGHVTTTLRPGSGLRGLTDRVEALGGQILVRTTEGGGVTVQAEIPSR